MFLTIIMYLWFGSFVFARFIDTSGDRTKTCPDILFNRIIGTIIPKQVKEIEALNCSVCWTGACPMRLPNLIETIIQK